MSIKEYRDMYHHVRVSGERKSEILSEITEAGETRQSEHKHPRLMMAAAIVAAALVVILPVGGYASRKLNTYFSYSVESQAKDRTATLHFYKKYGETSGCDYTMEHTNEATLTKYIRNAHPNYYVKLSYAKEALGVGKDYTIWKQPTEYADDYGNVRFLYKDAERVKLMEQYHKEKDSEKRRKLNKTIKKYLDKTFTISVYYINRSKDIRMINIKDVEKMTIGEKRAYYFKGSGSVKGQTKQQRKLAGLYKGHSFWENSIWVFEENLGYCMEISGGDGVSEKEMKKIARAVTMKKTTKENSAQFSVISAAISADE